MTAIDRIIKHQEERKERERKMCADYAALKEQYPTVPPYAIVDTMAWKYKEYNARIGSKYFPTTVNGVMNVIVRNGLHQHRPKTRKGGSK